MGNVRRPIGFDDEHHPAASRPLDQIWREDEKELGWLAIVGAQERRSFLAAILVAAAAVAAVSCFCAFNQCKPTATPCAQIFPHSRASAAGAQIIDVAAAFNHHRGADGYFSGLHDATQQGRSPKELTTRPWAR